MRVFCTSTEKSTLTIDNPRTNEHRPKTKQTKKTRPDANRLLREPLRALIDARQRGYEILKWEPGAGGGKN